MLDTPSDTYLACRYGPATNRVEAVQHEGEQKEMSPARARLLACSRRPPSRCRFGQRRRRLEHRRRRIDPAAVDSTSAAADGAPAPRDSTSAAADLRSATAGSTSAAVDSSSAAAESTL